MKQEHLTESQKNSAYFATDGGYDKNVYENDMANWFKIVGAFILFYVVQGLHWWANFELGVSDTETSTTYNLIIFIVSVLIIAIMVIYGNSINDKKLTHEFYQEKISEEKQRQAEKQAKEAQHAANEAKIAGMKKWKKNSCKFSS